MQECNTRAESNRRAQVRVPRAMCKATHACNVAHILWPSRPVECETFAGTTRLSHSIRGTIDCSMDERRVSKCFSRVAKATTLAYWPHAVGACLVYPMIRSNTRTCEWQCVLIAVGTTCLFVHCLGTVMFQTFIRLSDPASRG